MVTRCHLQGGRGGSHVQGTRARTEGGPCSGERGSGARVERTEQRNFTGDSSTMCLTLRFAPHCIEMCEAAQNSQT